MPQLRRHPRDRRQGNGEMSLLRRRAIHPTRRSANESNASGTDYLNSIVDNIRISDELVVDIAPDGTLYGIELLNTNKQLRGEDMKLLVINEATGEKAELKLSVNQK